MILLPAQVYDLKNPFQAHLMPDEPAGTAIPDYVLAFAKDFSRFKTPEVRTKGAVESANQSRGEPDWIDTVATLMLWHVLARGSLPVTIFITANSGDITDLRVQRKGSPQFIDINVKATKTPVREGVVPCDYGNVPVKQEELSVDVPGLEVDGSLRSSEGKCSPTEMTRKIEVRSDGQNYVIDETGRALTQIAHIFMKVFVHEVSLNPTCLPKSHVHLNPTCLPESHVHFCNWIASDSSEFRESLDAFLDSIRKGRPQLIQGICHPGLWIPSSRTHPATDLWAYLNERVP
jgi:hypothetical protein